MTIPAASLLDVSPLVNMPRGYLCQAAPHQYQEFVQFPALEMTLPLLNLDRSWSSHPPCIPPYWVMCHNNTPDCLCPLQSLKLAFLWQRTIKIFKSKMWKVFYTSFPNIKSQLQIVTVAQLPWNDSFYNLYVGLVHLESCRYTEAIFI